MNNQSWGLVDKLIFEAYKDKCLFNSEKFKKQIIDDFGYCPSSDLYRDIINYQIKRYGKQLDFQDRPEVKHFSSKNRKGRENTKRRIINNKREERFEERIENEIKRKNNKCKNKI